MMALVTKQRGRTTGTVKKGLPALGTGTGEGESAREGEEAEGEPVCRICYADGVACPGLVTLCACRGTVGHVHLACLELWINKCRSTRCELCHEYYRIASAPRYGRFKSAAMFFWAYVLKFFASLLLFTAISPFAVHQGMIMKDLVTLFAGQYNMAGITPHFVLLPIFFFVGAINLVIFLISVECLINYFLKEWQKWTKANRRLFVSNLALSRACR